MTYGEKGLSSGIAGVDGHISQPEAFAVRWGASSRAEGVKARGPAAVIPGEPSSLSSTDGNFRAPCVRCL